MSYKGYDDFIISVGEEMNNKGITFEYDGECY